MRAAHDVVSVPWGRRAFTNIHFNEEPSNPRLQVAQRHRCAETKLKKNNKKTLFSLMMDIGNCAMRFDLARQLREKLKSVYPYWLDNLGQLDLYESRFDATIEDWTPAYAQYGARCLRIAVPQSAIGNRPIDGVTGIRGGDEARTVVVDVGWCDNMSSEHPMLPRGAKSFLVPAESDALFDWMTRFVEYDDSSVDKLCHVSKDTSVSVASFPGPELGEEGWDFVCDATRKCFLTSLGTQTRHGTPLC